MTSPRTATDLVVTEEGIGRLRPTGEVELVALPHPDLGAVLRAFHSLTPVFDAPTATVRTWADVRLRAPLGAALQWGVGLNHRSKAVRTGRAEPLAPTVFVKPGSATAAPGAPITLPRHASTEFDFEGELAVVIGKPTWRVTVEDALDHVVAITAANDFTARDVLRDTGNPTLAKSFPRTAALGPALRPWPVDLDSVVVRTDVNGVLRQSARATDVFFDVAPLVAIISSYVELGPGDVVLTGTPAGTGDEDGRHLAPGDTIAVRVADLPPLLNQVVVSEVALL